MSKKAIHRRHKNRVLLVTPIPNDRRIDVRTARWCGVMDRRDWVTWAEEMAYAAECARNKAVNAMLTDGHGITHLMFVDGDTVPPLGALDKLLAADKDIISGVYPIYSKAGRPTTMADGDGGGHKVAAVSVEEGLPMRLLNWPLKYWVKSRTQAPMTELFKAMGVGGGCLLIKRKVLEGMEWPWFSTVYQPSGIKMGHDFHFCVKARKVDFEVWCDPTVVCEHFRPGSLNDQFKG